MTIMKNYFYPFLLIATFATAKNKFSTDSINPLSTSNKATTNIINEKKIQLESLTQSRIKYEQDLQKTTQSLVEINQKLKNTSNKNNYAFLQKTEQLLHKIDFTQKELISFFSTFIDEVESSLTNTVPFFIFPVDELSKIITRNEKLVVQLAMQQDTEKIKQEKEEQELLNIINDFSNESAIKQLEDLKNKLLELQKEKHQITNSFIAFLKKEIFFLKEKTIPSPLTRSTKSSKSIGSSLPRLINYTKNNSYLSKFSTTLIGLLGSIGLYKYATKNKRKNLEKKGASKIGNKISRENFSHYYGSIPSEIEQLKDNSTQLKEVFLVGPGKKFLVQCLAGELNTPFNSITLSELIQLIKKKVNKINQKNEVMQIIEREFSKYIKDIQKKTKQLGAKTTIIHLDKIGLITEELAILPILLNTVQNMNHQKNMPQLIISYALSSSELKEPIEALGCNVIEISLPDEQTRKKIFSDANLESKLPIQNIKDLVENTNQMKVSEIQSIVQKLQNFKGEKPFTIQELVQKEKSNKREKLLKNIATVDLSFPKNRLSQYIGEIPSSFINFIKKTKDNSNTLIKKILLSGPPKSGKKHLAKSIAGEYDAFFVEIPVQDLVKEGDNLQKDILQIQKAALQANNKRVIVYIDGYIDSFIEQFSSKIDKQLALKNISSQIEKVNNASNENLPHVLLIGSLKADQEDLAVAEEDNILTAISEELIGPETFDNVVEIPFPTAEHRKKIFEQYGQYNKTVNLTDFAQKTEGMFPGNIRKLIHKAKISAEERGKEEIFSEDLYSAGKEIFEKTKKEANDSSLIIPGFAGDPPKKIIEAYNQLNDQKHFTEKYNLSIPTGILLTGPPGSGKTIAIEGLAKKLRCPIITLHGSEFAQKYIGDGAKKVGDAFFRAREIAKNPKHKNKKAVIVAIDEADVLLRSYDSENQTKAGTSATRAKFLNEMNRVGKDNATIKNRPPIVVIAATNEATGKLDKASIRPGRFDIIAKMDHPNKEARKEILRYYLKRHNLAGKINDIGLNQIAEETEKFVGADLAYGIKRAIINNELTKTEMTCETLLQGLKEAKQHKKDLKKGKSYI